MLFLISWGDRRDGHTLREKYRRRGGNGDKSVTHERLLMSATELQQDLLGVQEILLEVA